MVSVDCMLISILVVSVEVLEMSCPVVAEALALWTCDLKADELLSLLHLMCDLGNPNLSCIQVNVPSSPSWPVQTLILSASHNVSFASQTRSCTP